MTDNDIQLTPEEEKQIDDILQFVSMSGEFSDQTGIKVSKKKLVNLIKSIAVRLWNS